jgi:phosphoribosylamine--glycine ligase
MKILLLGSGGREHALAWKLAQSNRLEALFIAPGNAGTLQHGTNVPLNPNDVPSIKQWILNNLIDLVVVGPEEPLVKGIVDSFRNDPLLQHIPVIGPSANGAMLEGSKDFAKQFMNRHGIPTARYQTFDRSSLDNGIAFLRTLNPPYVLKADGLAAGKGVVILHDEESAAGELTKMLRDNKFGAASNRVVIEEFLHGIELSAFVITDGKDYLMLPEAKDYKKIGAGDTGPNTGGMGSVSPVSFADHDFMQKVENRIIRPTISGLQMEGIDYRGFIFFGLMNVSGEPYVIEYNCRMGDPECESVIPRISNDLVDLFEAVSRQELCHVSIQTDPRSIVTVMLVSEGYPGTYVKGYPITGMEDVKESLLFHAGTTMDMESGLIITAGGRVIAVTSFGQDIHQALGFSYQSADKIRFTGKYYRHDIGFDLC